MNPNRLTWILLLCVAAPVAGRMRGNADAAPHRANPAGPAFRQPDPKVAPDLFVWSDTCNTYIFRDGESALLIDLGDGSVLNHLDEIGVSRIEWVLFTHHHREQCQGFPRLKGSGAQVAAPEAERALFEHPTDFRKMNVRLGDSFSIHGASYVRPPLDAIPLARALRPMDTFSWRGRDLLCVDSRGNSPGAVTYLLRRNDRWLAFSGDVMLDGARMHTWFDTEWDYGFAAGIHALHNSAGWLAGYAPLWLLPSHGPPVREAQAPLREFQAKLRRLERLYVRGYDVSTFAAGYQDNVSTPTAVSNVWQVSPHLFKFKAPNFWPNFGLILADSGRALVVDCGLLDEKALDAALEGMRAQFGLKQIDAAVITHMHGDHFLEAPHLRERWGAQTWALDRMAPGCEHPERFDYAAPIQAYGKKGVEGVRFDRLFKSGETFPWEGYRFTVDWMPGQTEFALCLHGTIDGRKVAFTGDNLFGDPSDRQQTGHEAVVAHNSAVLEEGYIYAGEYLKRLKPDLLIGGHSFVMDRPPQFIERFRRWAYGMREAFQALSSDTDYRYGFDPYWVRVEPYRATLQPGQAAEGMVHVRNFRSRDQAHRIEFHAPPGFKVEPATIEGKLAPHEKRGFPIHLEATDAAAPGVHIVALDVTLDGRRYGEWFDCIVQLQGTRPAAK
jgi:glyoxylase-like metal-dependent hydrolase (beta-lactamase superfamily II)